MRIRDIIKLRVVYYVGPSKPTLVADGTVVDIGTYSIMNIRKGEADLSSGRFKNFLPPPHHTSDNELLKYSVLCPRFQFSHILEWAQNTDGKWFSDFYNIGPKEHSFEMFFEMQSDVLLFRLMFPEGIYLE